MYIISFNQLLGGALFKKFLFKAKITRKGSVLAYKTEIYI